MIRNVVPHQGHPLAAGGFGMLGGGRSARAKTRFVRSDRPRLLAGDERNEGAGAAAKVFAAIAASRRAAGRPISQADGQIAAIANAHGAKVATRNVDDFWGCGIEIVNPWTA